ncbi:MAG TPA: hypothetical protein DEG17_20345 [Cyanobacteria bacterium UBA11149]|nr:hypothetical protein [Cyanobacteria bacterium UBA11367]HBE58876.1 hypothetical protein [Cyanobacteria bacterium UBA11366]HBK62519.1 hypothetical protein [Cyanobacteria bacterium UBA11166]HBR75825.1 hypothetical protein [Cyanobacteria bacterium UBA11159]HBS72312.1 hypothetical protein [Cyanobacteria bacterium UBA11153]HBW91146.1 hypothetical protein [Cyanobacteria bacterium UBA11149]HCA94393.1 hypothetical protein [Cyanobacteria bacterium UBA9226]
MNNKVLTVTMALPILLIQVCQNFTSYHASEANRLPFSILKNRIIEVVLDIEHKSPFLIAARDEKTKECRWVGSCEDPVGSR